MNPTNPMLQAIIAALANVRGSTLARTPGKGDVSFRTPLTTVEPRNPTPGMQERNRNAIALRSSLLPLTRARRHNLPSEGLVR